MALLKGTLDILVLKTLSWGPMHGFEITQWIERQSSSKLGFTDAALLQALHRLEERALLAASWGETANGRRARYYEVTPAGQDYLRDESASLVDQVQALVSVLALSSPGR